MWMVLAYYCLILAQIIPKTFRIYFHEEKNWNFSSKKFYVADLNKCRFRGLSDEFWTFFDDFWGSQNCEKSSWTVPMADKLIKCKTYTALISYQIYYLMYCRDFRNGAESQSLQHVRLWGIDLVSCPLIRHCPKNATFLHDTRKM